MQVFWNATSRQIRTKTFSWGGVPNVSRRTAATKRALLVTRS